jgi:hypothetical protein
VKDREEPGVRRLLWCEGQGGAPKVSRCGEITPVGNSIPQHLHSLYCSNLIAYIAPLYDMSLYNELFSSYYQRTFESLVISMFCFNGAWC